MKYRGTYFLPQCHARGPFFLHLPNIFIWCLKVKKSEPLGVYTIYEFGHKTENKQQNLCWCRCIGGKLWDFFSQITNYMKWNCIHFENTQRCIHTNLIPGFLQYPKSSPLDLNTKIQFGMSDRSAGIARQPHTHTMSKLLHVSSNRNAITDSVIGLASPICHMLNCLFSSHAIPVGTGPFKQHLCNNVCQCCLNINFWSYLSKPCRDSSI